MNYSTTILFAEDKIEDDEIDVLFGQLQQIAPPPTLVENILASVARLGVPKQHPMQRMWDDMGLVACNEDQDLA